jgi:hypothetical protein
LECKIVTLVPPSVPTAIHFDPDPAQAKRRIPAGIPVAGVHDRPSFDQ